MPSDPVPVFFLTFWPSRWKAWALLQKRISEHHQGLTDRNSLWGQSVPWS